jgi:uncharacterized repeat protein (TIGR01451 family)
MFKQILTNNIIKKTTTAFAVLCLLMVSVLASFAAAPIAKATGAPITGTIFADFNRDGRIDLGEKIPSTDTYYPPSGVTVMVYDSTGASVPGVVTSGANGVTYTADVSSLAGTQFRVEYGISTADKTAGFTDTTIGVDSETSVAFVNAGEVQNFGFIPPSKAPVTGTGADGNVNNVNGKLFSTLFVNGKIGDTGGPQSTLQGINYDLTGKIESLGKKSEMGTVYGVTYDEWSSMLFTSSYIKTHTALGPKGISGLYFMNYPSEVTTGVALDTLGGPSFGAIGPRDSDTASFNALTKDATAFAKVGKEGIGDIELSKDGRTLYVTNIFSKAVMAYDVTNAKTGQISYLGHYPITNTDASCPNASGNNNPSDWYPFALAPVDGDSLFVGITCTAQTSQSEADLTAKVLELKLIPAGPTNLNGLPVSSKEVLSQAIGYNRGCPFGGACTTGGFNPWSDDPTKFNSLAGGRIMYPTPIFSDINISNDGSLTLNILDRSADQFGDLQTAPGGQYLNVNAGGEILKVCNTGTVLNPVYVMEGKPGCLVGAQTDPGVNGKEFYNDNYGGLHPETTSGGAWAHPYLNELASNQMDAEASGNVWSGGISKLNSLTGAELASKNMYYGAGDYGTGGKANGVGDLEGAYIPVIIGDYVWLDMDGDGIQDPNELPLAGATVTITGPGLPTAGVTVKTDASGHYQFDSSNGIKPGVAYTIKFDPTTTTNLPAGILPSSLKPTTTGAGTNPLIDSNINTSGTLTTLPLVLGQSNQSYDAGFIPPIKAIDDIKVTLMNTPITYSPLANDFAPVGSKITSINGITVVIGTPILVPNGSVVVNPDGTVTFTPNPGYVGTTSFPYVITAPNGQTSSAIDTITIEGVGKLDLIKTGTFVDTNGDGAGQVGDQIKYTFSVKNSGALALSGVKITDNKCTPVLGGPISMAPGAIDSTTFTCIYTLTTADLVAGRVDNSATATGTDPNGKLVSDISDSTDPNKPGLDDPTVTLIPIKAVDDTNTTPVNTPVKVCPLINDMVPVGTKITGINGQVATVGVPIQVPNGTATLDADGCVTFTPNPGYTGTSTFPYEVTTLGGVKTTANITITITGDAKIDLTKTSTLVDTNGNGYTDLGDKLKYVFSVKNTGTLVVSNIIITDNKCSPVTNSPIPVLPVGAVNSTPTCDYTITAADIALGKVDNSATATGTDPSGKPVVDVSDDGNNPNTPGTDNPTVSLLVPKAIDDVKTTPLNTPITYNPLVNDIIPTGSTITKINGVTPVVGTPILVPNGTVTLNPDNTFTFTPNPGYVGSTTFPYEVTTPTGVKVTANDTITITGTGSIELIKASSFVDTNTNGAAEVGETIKYTFTVKNTGALALTGVTVTDNKCSPVLGGPINMASGAVDASTFTCTYTLTAADILLGKVDNSATVTGKDPTGASVTDISDSTDPSKPGTNDPTVTPLPSINPVANPDIKETPVNTPVKICPLANDMPIPPASKITSINGITAVVGTPIIVPNGTVTLDADGCITFTPNPGYTGTSSFPYEVTTPNGTKVTSTVTVTIVGAVDDTKTTPINTPITYSPLVNDNVPAGSKITSINGTPVVIGTPITVPNGTVIVNNDGTVTFTPNPGYTGSTSFPYEVTTPNGTIVKAIDTITIIGPDPIAVNDTKETPINTPITYSPLANDSVPAGSKITSINNTPVVVGQPITVPNGTVVVNADQTVTFTPAPGYTGTTSFPYEVTTPDNKVVKAIDTITIVGAVDDSKTTPLNTPITYSPLVNDNVPAGSKITSINGTPVVVGTPITVPNGTVVVNSDQSVTFTPAPGYSGTVVFPYEVTTPSGTVVKAIDTIVIPPANLVLVDDNKTTPLNTPITYSPMANETVPTGSTITKINGITVVPGTPITVPNGTVVVNADQSVTFTPAPGYSGTVVFPYEVTTPAGVKATAIDTIVIPPAAPVLTPDVKETPVNTPVKICPLANDMVPAGSVISSVNGMSLTVGTPVQVPNGTVMLEADGCIKFTPAPGYTGVVTFPYEVTTPAGVKVASTVTVTIVGAVDDNKVTPLNTPITYSPMINDQVPVGSKITSINGVPATVGTPITVPNGTVVLNADQTVTFTPNNNYVGQVVFPYEVTTPSGTVVKAIDTITINGEGKIELDKAATYTDTNGDGKLSLGETVKYVFTIRNTGTTPLTNVIVTDTMPGIVITGTPIPTLLAGATNNTAYSATYVVTQADLDKGMVVNQATVNGKDPQGKDVKDLSNDPSTVLGKDPTTLLIPKPATCAPCGCATNTCAAPCAGQTGCNTGCGNGNCMPISSISCITNTNTVTITGGAGPMVSPVYNYNNVFNSNVNFTQGPISFDFSPVVNNYYK